VRRVTADCRWICSRPAGCLDRAIKQTSRGEKLDPKLSAIVDSVLRSSSNENGKLVRVVCQGKWSQKLTRRQWDSPFRCAGSTSSKCSISLRAARLRRQRRHGQCTTRAC